MLIERDDGFTLSAAIPLGADNMFTAPADGRLYLRCNDAWTELADNSGEIEVVLRRAARD